MLMVVTLATLGIIIAATQPASAVTITYPNFSSTIGLKLNGYNDQGQPWTAKSENNKLQLTNDYHQAGSAFFTGDFMFGSASDIDTEFQFQITNTDLGGPGQGADGLAFVIQGDPRGSSAYGQTGSAIGYAVRPGNPPSSTEPAAIYKAFAVEFDTFYSPDQGDPSGNHVAITAVRPDGLIDHLFSTTLAQPLNDGQIKDVEIHYKGSTNLLQVFLDGTKVLEGNVDIIHQIFPEAYFGFTASTGGHTGIHEILSWTLTVPEPTSLMMLSLGLVTLGVARRQNHTRNAS